MVPQLFNRTLLRQGTEAGIGGVAFAAREGRRPERHQAITDKLVDNAVARVNGCRHLREVCVKELDQGGGS